MSFIRNGRAVAGSAGHEATRPPPDARSATTATPLSSVVAQTPVAAFSVQRAAVVPASPAADYAPIVDDAAAALLPGQLRKSAFLARAEREVCVAVDEVLRPGGQSTDGCPYLIGLFPRLRRMRASGLNALLARYGAVRSAADLLALIVQRARRSARAWLATGQLEDVPEVSGLLAGDDGGEELQAKARDGGTTPSPGDPGAVRAALGPGTVFGGAARGQMESAFGESFSHVRIHQDARADSLAQRYGALAFTVGNHVAFARGSYAPGTPAGDALLAHELAHVRQQRGAGLASSRATSVDAPRFERNADGAAVHVLGRLYGRGAAPGVIPPAATGGLALHRCKSEKKPAPDIKPLQSKTLSKGTPLEGTMYWKVVPADNNPDLAVMQVWYRPGEALKKSAQRITFIQTLSATGEGGAPIFQDDGGGAAFAGPKNVTVDFVHQKDFDQFYSHDDDVWTAANPDHPAYLGDAPMTSARKDFETVAVVEETGQVLGALRWSSLGPAPGGTQTRVLGAEDKDCTETASSEFQPAVERFFANRYDETLEDFAPNSADLSATDRTALDRVSAALSADPKKLAVIHGYADLSETDPVKTAEARTAAAVAYLVSHGVTIDRIRSESLGATQARVPTVRGTPQALNRRVHIVFAFNDATSPKGYQLGDLPVRGRQ
jgi:outer membrane protein OmpA-like peptidoglycan-associated protein